MMIPNTASDITGRKMSVSKEFPYLFHLQHLVSKLEKRLTGHREIVL